GVMDTSEQLPELLAEIELLRGVGTRQPSTWRPSVRPVNSSTDAPAFGIAFSSSPHQASGGDRFTAKMVVLGCPDPGTGWLHQQGAKFCLLEGATTVGRGCILGSGGASGIDA